ncbi:putative lipoprotein [Leptospira inadai serovar Lyme str. 10]|uniref:Lipoprotein n=2 Tax=Leptospira inadai serovar Lyme TaxID=293084 RepID=A0ABX4YD51_9LEPT|nr:hypothetical protein [Leptospira inadai]EQA37944.1 putative lipoprotein [Leptospira inadai serovar Lyme str. 10]PNV72073.1 hypothetical protein BES34_020195 [Leptospira inadai serovar Lyme]
MQKKHFRNLIFLFLHLSLVLLGTGACSSRPAIIAEPVIEQTSLRSGPICISSWFCSGGRSGSLNFKGILNNRSGEKTLFLEYYVSSFEESFPLGVSIKLDQTWHNLRKVSTEYGDTLRLVSMLPIEVADKIQSAKEIEFSFSSREHTTTRSLGAGEVETFKNLLKETRSRLEAQTKLTITNY